MQRPRETPFFIVGCPRSGTTLLTDLLRRHPRLAIPIESHFIPEFYRRFGNPRTAAESVKLATELLKLPRVRRFDTGLAAESFAPDRTFAAIVDRLYSAFAARKGKPRWADKTPHYVEHIPLLLKLFPGARILHIIRDGRDVAPSWVKAAIEPGNLFTAITMWDRMVRAGRKAGAALPPETYLELRYEDLLAATREVMTRVCAFINEPMCDEVLAPNRETDSTQRRLIGPPRMVNPKGNTVRTDNSGKWRNLPRKDRVLMESAAGPLLQELGYETEGIARNIGSVERTAWRMHHAAVYYAERLNGPEAPLVVKGFLRMKWDALRGKPRTA